MRAHETQLIFVYKVVGIVTHENKKEILTSWQKEEMKIKKSEKKTVRPPASVCTDFHNVFFFQRSNKKIIIIFIDVPEESTC